MQTLDFSAPAIPGYGIRPGYVARDEPEYFLDLVDCDIVYQPDVYLTAAHVARTLSATRIVDIGSGSGEKLVELHPEFELMGIDFGANLDGCRARYPWGEWRHHDLEEEVDLPVSGDELEGAVIVASDVIEHLKRPELLLRKLALSLRHARAVIISTPERDATYGAVQLGPPRNPAHVREWTQHELGTFLESEGLRYGDVGLTRSNDADDLLATTLAVLVGDDEDAQRLRAAA